MNEQIVNQAIKYDIVFPTTKFFAKDQTGNIRVWSISGVIGTRPKDGSQFGNIKFQFGTVDGVQQEEVEWVYEGLQSRNLKEQILSRINSRIHNKKKLGYVDKIEDAQSNHRVNLLGLKRPMLAKKFKDESEKINWEKGVYIQPKLNGERCLINKCDGEVTAYSRQGIKFTTLDHIIDIVKQIPGDFTLDGELYTHGVKLQTINSWVKRKQENTKRIQYSIYDIVADSNYTSRKSILESIQQQIGFNDSVNIVPSFMVTSEDNAFWYRDLFIKDGYEGAMIRINEFPYQDGKRSKSLLKMKKALDGEFLVCDICDSVHGWAILMCATSDGKIFSVSAPGSIEEKTEIYLEKEKYIGRYCQIEFFEWTIDKKPFHPVALRFRDIAKE